MANASFTKDEAILALDVLYSLKGHRALPNSSEMNELSSLLKRLPIHNIDKQNADFRSPSGIANQLNLFQRSLASGKKHPNVGKIFFDVAFEYEHKQDELHATAQAIRRNEAFFDDAYNSIDAVERFPEGILLGRLHRKLESRASARVTLSNCCAICNIKPELCYQPCGNLLQLHLLVSPSRLNGEKKYSANSFITVCPTCHAALHAYRPWRTNENCGDILR